MYEHVLEEIQHSYFFPQRFILKLKNALKCTHLKSLNMYASVRVQCECLFACFYCKKILLLWLAVQSVRAETHSEGVNDSVARSSWEGFSVYNPSLLLFTLTAPLSTSVQTTNLSRWLNNQSGMKHNHLYSVKTLLVLRY